jgi:hypothetical protein
MFAYILGPVLFGWYGLFLGPLLLVLVVHFVRLVLPELVDGEPIEPTAVDPLDVADGQAMPGAPDPDETDESAATDGSETEGSATTADPQTGGEDATDSAAGPDS